MNGMLTLEKIASENQLAKGLDFPGFWDMKKLVYLQSILAVCKSRRIKKDDLPSIGNACKKAINSMLEPEPEPENKSKNKKQQKYRFNQAEKKQCNEVIEHLQNNGWRVTFYQIKARPYRPSILPMEQRKFVALNFANQLRKNFWNGQNTEPADITSMALIEAVASTGISTNKLFSALRDQNMHTAAQGWLELPVSRGCDHYIKIPISDQAKILFNWCVINSIGLHEFNQALENKYPNSGADNNEYSFFSLAELLSALQNQPFHNGIEAILCSQLQEVLLPVPRKHGSFLKAAADPSLPAIVQREQIPKHSKAVHSEPSDKNTGTSKFNSSIAMLTDINQDLPPELEPTEDIESIIPWSQETIITLCQLRSQLKKRLTDSGGTYHNAKLPKEYVMKVTGNAVRLTLARAYKRALRSASKTDIAKIKQAIKYLKNAFTGLELAVERIREHLIEKQNTLDTCLAEMSNLFLYGILRFPAAANLRNWDEEDFEILMHEYLLDRDVANSLNDETKRNILSSFKSLINYSQSTFSLFQNVDIALDEKGFNLRTRRNQVFGPLEFDQLDLEGNPVSLLAFYAGLRSGEIANLRLGDIVASDSELVIYVKKGKTPSAKRSIPLHLLAPKRVVDSIRDCVDLRQVDYRRYIRDAKKKKEKVLSRKQIYLLSKNHNCRTNTAHYVVREALNNLKSQAGPGADLHLLRHSFASHLFLRWYSCRHSDFIGQLVDEPHWFFSAEGLGKLRQFFGEKPDVPIPDSNITAFIHIIKLFGHKTATTLFQVYIHSFDTVVQHALKKSHEADNNEELSGKMITLLIPNKRSRKSQVNLEGRKVKDLAKLI